MAVLATVTVVGTQAGRIVVVVRPRPQGFIVGQFFLAARLAQDKRTILVRRDKALFCVAEFFGTLHD
jgi:hypothetical protein